MAQRSWQFCFELYTFESVSKRRLFQNYFSKCDFINFSISAVYGMCRKWKWSSIMSFIPQKITPNGALAAKTRRGYALEILIELYVIDENQISILLSLKWDFNSFFKAKQTQRGGGTVCRYSKVIADAYRTMIADFEPCTKLPLERSQSSPSVLMNWLKLRGTNKDPPVLLLRHFPPTCIYILYCT